MRTNVLAAALVVVVSALWSGDVKAASAVGVWKSTSGNSFTIPASQTDFDIVCKNQKGEKSLLQGKWSQGKVGHQFTYGNGNVICTFDVKNPDTLTCQLYDPKTQMWSTTYWVRVN